MKLTIELTDHHVAMLFDCLKISVKQFDMCYGKSKETLTGEAELAYRILQARCALDLNNSTIYCCHDFMAIARKENE